YYRSGNDLKADVAIITNLTWIAITVQLSGS
ncbi:hypothetical protein HKBW3S43_01969, partial [Candidatus Hakubella thermalkaliphila]